jgi:hypothetical protein
MIVCEFCLNYTSDGQCRIGLNLPKGMSCRDFSPGMTKFCSDPKDFSGPNQIVEMAKYFGLRKTELKKVALMAANEERARL